MASKNFFLNGIGSVYLICIQSLGILCLTHLLIHYLPAIYVSAWFLFMSLALFVNLFDFGLSPTLSREIGLSHTVEGIDQKRVLSSIYTAISLNMVLAVFLLFLGAIGGCVYFAYVFPEGVRSSVLIGYSYFLVGTFFVFLTNPFFAIHYGFGEVAKERFLRSLVWIFGITLISCGIHFHFSFVGLTKLWLLQGFLLHVVVRAYTQYRYKLVCLKLYIDLAQFKRMSGPSIRWAVMSFGALLILQSSGFVIAGVLQPELVARYTPLMQLATALINIGGVVQLSLVPMVSKLAGKEMHEKIRDIFLLASRVSLSLVIPLAIVLFFWGGEIVHLWLGNHFVYSASILMVLVLMAILETHHVSCAAVVMATGYVKFMIPALLSGVLTIVFSICFAHFWGLLGVALGVMLAQLFTNNWYVIFVSIKILKIKKSVFFYNLLPVLSYTSLLSIFAFFLNKVPSVSILGCFVKIGVFLFFVALCLLMSYARQIVRILK